MLGKLFKKKQPKTENAIFSNEELQQWPSSPNKNGKVPSVKDIIGIGGDAGRAAETLVAWCEKAKKDSDNIEYQAVMESQYGLFALPAIIQHDNSKKFTVYYSNAGEWSENTVSKLLQWTVFLRACDFVHTFKVIICDDNPPQKVKEIVSVRKEHRMLVSMIPNIKKGDYRINARVFSECFAFFCNDKKLLNFDANSLSLVENWYTKEVKSTAKDSWHYSLFVRLIGAWFGELLINSCTGQWCEGEWPAVELINGDSRMKVNVFQLVSDYVCSPHLRTSLEGNFKLISDSYKSL